MLRVSWTAKKTNEWVLNKAGVKRELLETVKTFDMAIRHTRQTTRTELRVFSAAGFIFTYVQKYSME